MEKIKDSNKFTVGCNYWASHAGIGMWEDWRSDVVEEDLIKLSQHGLEVLRVFPLWPVFQPVSLLYGGAGTPIEYRINEQPLTDDEEGRAGISAIAIDRFEEFTEIVRRRNFKLIVGLITGWMSGRLFVPPALNGKNILTDPTAIKWQARFIKYFVHRFRNNDAIAAWDLGNECNCMQVVNSRDEAWTWTCIISGAIRSEDNTRPIVSGMHSLSTQDNWTIQDQSELTDILTTHPYPIFTPHCDIDPVNTIRTLLHSSAESVFYADISKKPCMVEEIGTLGPMVASNSVAADFARTTLFSTWVHGCSGYLWWCANDQSHLEFPPYEWFAVERELGLLDAKGNIKPVLAEISAFQKTAEGLPFDKLPQRITDGVCILSYDQDQWGVAFGSFILAKQSGMDIAFAYVEQPLKKASFYLLPCVRGHRVMPKKRWQELMEHIYSGATLYISYDGGFLSEFEQFSGVRVETRFKRNKQVEACFNLNSGEIEFSLDSAFGVNLSSLNAKVIGKEQNNNPAFTCASYGKGKVYFLAHALETQLSNTPGVFHADGAQEYWRIYRHMLDGISTEKCIKKNHGMIGITEHPIDQDTRIVVLINYSDKILQDSIKLTEGWDVIDCFYGNKPVLDINQWIINIQKNNAIILKVSKLNT